MALRETGTYSAAGASLTLERASLLEDLRDDWDRLAEGAGHPFGTWEWVTAWWRHLGGGKELFTFACRDSSGRLRAILPLYLARERPRVARFLGYGDQRSPLCAEEDRGLAAAGMKALLGRGDDRCSLLLAEMMPGHEGWDVALGGSLIRTDADPVIHLNGASWEDYLATKSGSFRKQARYQERRLARDHALEFRMTEDASQLDGDFDTLVALHATRWGDTTTGVFEGARGQMQRELAATALDRGWLRLWIEEVDGVPAAAYYGLRYAGSEFFYQSGRDPSFDRLSVGAVMLAHAVRDACSAGIETFRFLAGDESYKLRLADDDYRSQTRLLGGGLTGIAGRAAIKTIRNLPDERRARVLRRLT
jgi:CelD/BcsL family acetyltransferase involved in cellulose biosynthesis